jgi:aldose 1-epimerase
MAEPDDLVLDARRAVAVVAVRDGGRLRSLSVDGIELLVTSGERPVMWGSYPMVPFAGRIRDGAFTFRGRAVKLERNWPPNAMHGTGFVRPWEVTGPATIATDLGPGWPFRGRVKQLFTLDEDGLDVRMTVEADDAMPVTIGWHPWFLRQLALPGGIASAPVEVVFEASAAYERRADGLPTGRTIRPGPPPWDDCLIGLRADPVLTWPGTLTLTVASSLDHWVIYTERSNAVCVEPQSGPPDAVNIGGATIMEAGDSLAAWMTWSWRRPG